MTTKHTPTPWAINPCGDVVRLYETETGSYSMGICLMDRDMPNFKTEPLANAEFIVRACNAYDELVSVGQQIRLALHSGADLSELFECRCDDKENGHVCIGHQLEKALAKAKGEE